MLFLACGDDEEEFLLNFSSLLQMRATAEDARERGEFETRPFFRVNLAPNNFEYDSLASLAGLHGSGGVLNATRKCEHFTFCENFYTLEACHLFNYYFEGI